MRWLPNAAIFLRVELPRGGCYVVGASEHEDFDLATCGPGRFADRETFVAVAARCFGEYLARGLRAGELD